MLHNELKNNNKYPFHMPGHKRNDKFNICGSDIDITEIEGFDNLHNPTGYIKEIEFELEKLYNSNKSFLLVNGSTLGILCAVLAVTNKNDKIAVARNCHQSVFNACFLNELNIVYIEPEYNTENGFYTRISQETVDKCFKENPDIKAVVITNPTYEGFISNIISPVTLIVDSAHGAHFGFGNFPKYPKGDIIVSSLHKTLPALTQTAVLNVYNEKYISMVKKYIDILETSSPSYVLMSSVSKCIETLKNEPNLFINLENRLKQFYSIKLNNLNLIKNDDKSKIIISVANTNINGYELSDILRNKYLIECEAQSINYITLISSVGDTEEGFKRLIKALCEIDKSLIKSPVKIIDKPLIPIIACKSSEIKHTVKTNFENSINKICGETVFAYPPDIPIINKGEVITEETVKYINYCFKNKINIISESNLLPHFILTKAD